MLQSVWRRIRRDANVPGVVYSDDMYNIREQLEEQQSMHWLGNLRNVRLETAPALVLSSNGENRVEPGPEEEPYTFWERVGLMPVHPSRVRARQYYHPITDFGLYDYDEISPEEKQLTARWLSRAMEFNAAIPAGILALVGCIVLPLRTAFRMPLLVSGGIAGVAVEITKAYISASQERQDLDDFILAKEIWYIKNVETYQLGLPRMPHGREEEYQSYLDGSSSKTGTEQQLPDHLLDALHI